jgi:hypothetical protein
MILSGFHREVWRDVVPPKTLFFLGHCGGFAAAVTEKRESWGGEPPQTPPPFSLGLTYWPRRSAFGWWQSYDRGATRDELAHVAALGCDIVHFCLR